MKILKILYFAIEEKFQALVSLRAHAALFHKGLSSEPVIGCLGGQ